MPFTQRGQGPPRTEERLEGTKGRKPDLNGAPSAGEASVEIEDREPIERWRGPLSMWGNHH